MGQRDRRAGASHGLRGGRACWCPRPVGAVKDTMTHEQLTTVEQVISDLETASSRNDVEASLRSSQKTPRSRAIWSRASSNGRRVCAAAGLRYGNWRSRSRGAAGYGEDTNHRLSEETLSLSNTEVRPQMRRSSPWTSSR